MILEIPSNPNLSVIPGANFSLRELGLEDVPPTHGTLYRTDIGLPHCGYSISAGSDADTEADVVMSPEHPVRLWGRNTKSGRSSCLSSWANSNLTLTDTEHENTETGKWGQRMRCSRKLYQQCFFLHSTLIFLSWIFFYQTRWKCSSNSPMSRPFVLSYRVFVNKLLEKLLLIYHRDRDH